MKMNTELEKLLAESKLESEKSARLAKRSQRRFEIAIVLSIISLAYSAISNFLK